MYSWKSTSIIFTSLCCLLIASASFAFSPEFGKATYYNDKFEGKKTASGEPYQKGLLTCAHKSLKFGTIVRVTRIDDEQQSVDVRVNDRGPYHEGYVIDLSRAAGEQINLIKAGVLKVKVEVVEQEVAPAPTTLTEKPVKPVAQKASSAQRNTNTQTASADNPPMMPELISDRTTARSPVTASSKAPVTAKKLTAMENATYKVDVSKASQTGFAVQLFSLEDAEAALNQTAKLQTNFKGKVLLQTSSDGMFKVLLGPCKTRKEADILQKTATKKGHAKCFVVSLDADK